MSTILSWFGWNKEKSLHPKVPLPDKEILSKITHFSQREITKLYKRYCSICRQDGLLDARNFGLIPEISTLPLAPLAFEYEATEHMRQAEIDFNQFCLLLSHFSPKAPISEKVEYLFDIIKNNDGISTVKEADYTRFMIRLNRGTVPACTIVKASNADNMDERKEEGMGEEKAEKFKFITNGTIDEKNMAKFISFYDVRAMLTIYF